MLILYILFNLIPYSLGLSWDQINEKNSSEKIYGALKMISYTKPEQFQSYKDDVICRLKGAISDGRMKNIHLNNFKENINMGKNKGVINKIAITSFGIGCFYLGLNYHNIKNKTKNLFLSKRIQNFRPFKSLKKRK